MARAKKGAALTPEERLQAALVPDWEWPYKLPENWCWTRIGNYVDYVTDYVANGSFASLKVNVSIFKDENYALMVKTRDFANGFTKSLTYTDKHGYDFLSKSTLHGGELILSNIGSVGKVFRVPYFDRPMTLASNSVMVKCYNSRDYDWMYYFLLSPIGFEELKSITTGTAVPKFNKTDLKTIPLPVPPLAEQQRIVDRIESLFAKLDEAKEKAQAVVDSFETRKAAILHKAFTGELTAKWREEHDVGMESWEKHLLSTVSSLQTGLMKGKKYTGKTVELPYLRVANVQDGFLRLDEIKKIDVEENAISRYSLAVGDVLFTEGGDFDKLGRGTVWEGQIKNCLHQNHIFVVRPNPEVLNPYFLSYQAGSLYGKAYFLSCSKQTTNLASINSTQLKNFPVLIPSMMEQEVIIRLLDSSLEKEQQTKNIAESVLDQIELMKKSILARAFRGELGTNDPSEESAVELLKQII